MEELAKVKRVLRLIQFLADTPAKRVKTLAQLLETTDKSVYRYIKLLEELGYFIERTEDREYFLSNEKKLNAHTFEPEELNLLNSLIATIETENPLQQSLKKKIYLSSSLIPFSEDLVDKHQAKLVARLSRALEEKKQVCLIGYQTAISLIAQNRHIEPIQFIKSNTQLAAYDLDKKQIRHFKIKRMTDVEVLDDFCQHSFENYHTDIFGFTSPENLMVKLNLSIRASKLLAEEHPDTRAYIKEQNGKYPLRLVMEFASCIGIGRFILGLPGEIEVVEPQVLKEYLAEKIKEFSL
jgi:proteasome accessory factor C